MTLDNKINRIFIATLAILNLGELLSDSAPQREDLPGKTMMPKRSASKLDPADLVV